MGVARYSVSKQTHVGFTFSMLEIYTVRLDDLQIKSYTFSSHLYIKSHKGLEGLSVIVVVIKQSEMPLYVFGLKMQTFPHTGNLATVLEEVMGEHISTYDKKGFLHT